MEQDQVLEEPSSVVSARLTCVCLAAHADVSVTGELGPLVVAALVLIGHLDVLLSQKGHSFGHVSIADLQQQCQLYWTFSQFS